MAGQASRDSWQASLHSVAEDLESLHKEAHDAQGLAQQVAARLKEQAADIAETRQSIVRLLADSPAGAKPTPLAGEKPHWLFYYFGHFQVCRASECIPTRRAWKGLAILKYLAASPGQIVPRDVLLESLWPEIEPSVANNRLKVAMHSLRQTFSWEDLGQKKRDLILFRNGGYALNHELEIWSDVDAFEGSWQAGLQMERAGRLADAVCFYSQAEALYRGDFLEEDRLEEWTLVRREALKDTYLTILDKISMYWLRTDHPQRAIEGWKKILAKDPWREDVYRRLMVCFASRGQRAVALRWYQVCAQVIREQLGLELEPETQTLYEYIRSSKRIDQPVPL